MSGDVLTCPDVSGHVRTSPENSVIFVCSFDSIFVCSLVALVGSGDCFPARASVCVAAMEKMVCSFCGQESADCKRDGRKIWRRSCVAADKMLRRHMGGWPTVSDGEKKDFFSKALQAKDPNGRVTWTCLRGVLKECMAKRAMMRTSVDITAPFKPMAYWTSQGYTEERVRGCPCEEDPQLGTLYQVHTKTISRAKIEEEVEEELLMREQAANQKKSQKSTASADTWHVPEASAGESKGKSAAAEQRALERSQAKRERENAAASALAGKAVALLQPKVQQAQKLLDSHSSKLPRENVAELEVAVKEQGEWLAAARATVAAFGRDPAGALVPLPFDANGLKSAVTAGTSMLKSARLQLPKKETKERKSKAAPQPQSAAEPSKRRRAGKQKET